MMPMVEWLRLLILAASVPIASYVIARDVCLCLLRFLVRLELKHQGQIKLTRKNGQMELAQIMPSSYVTSHLTILHLKPHASRWQTYLLILPDSVLQASFRQLRAWLLWGVVFNQKESVLRLQLKPIEENQGLVEEI
jgi:hypothetical protein